MDLDLKLFEEGQADYSGKNVHVTIQKGGQLFLNRLAREALGDPESVALSFDSGRKIIGIQPVPLGHRSAFRLQRKYPKGRGRIVSAMNFCRHHAVVPDETIAFRSPTLTKDGIMLLDLNDTHAVTRKR